MKLQGIVTDELVRWVELSINAMGLGLGDQEILENLLLAENGLGIRPDHSIARKALAVAKVMNLIDGACEVAVKRTTQDHWMDGILPACGWCGSITTWHRAGCFGI